MGWPFVRCELHLAVEGQYFAVQHGGENVQETLKGCARRHLVDQYKSTQA